MKRYKRFLKWLKSGNKKTDRMHLHNQAIYYYSLVFFQARNPEVKEFAWKRMNLHLKVMVKINRL